MQMRSWWPTCLDTLAPLLSLALCGLLVATLLHHWQSHNTWRPCWPCRSSSITLRAVLAVVALGHVGGQVGQVGGVGRVLVDPVSENVAQLADELFEELDVLFVVVVVVVCVRRRRRRAGGRAGRRAAGRRRRRRFVRSQRHRTRTPQNVEHHLHSKSHSTHGGGYPTVLLRSVLLRRPTHDVAKCRDVGRCQVCGRKA